MRRTQRQLVAPATPWMFLAPFALIFLTFMVIHDVTFWQSMGRTTYFAVGSLLVQLPVALGLALLVHGKKFFGRAFFRTAFFMPVLVGAVFIGVAFKRIYGVQEGVLNQVLGLAAIPAIDWLRDPEVVLDTLILTGVWMFAGFNMVYFLAGLQGIPTELYEAATVDGAGVWGRFRHVTLPGIWPIAAFLITASTIGSFGLFDLPWVLMDRGGPGRASTTVMVYLYERGFLAGDLGYAAAMGWIITIVLLLIAVAQLRVSRAWTE